MKRSYSLLISILLPFLIAGITYFIVHGNQDLYATLLLPKHLTMSFLLYAFLWAIQYLLLGYASYLLYRNDNSDIQKLLILYALQLLFLFIWPILFFNIRDFLLTTIILLLSWGLSIVMIYTFYKIDKVASYFLIPYFIWVSYMLYYHFQIFLLN